MAKQPQEKWSPIVGYPHEISSLGRVRNVKSFYILTPHTKAKGHVCAQLNKYVAGRKEHRTIVVAHEVAKAFVLNPNHYHFVGHKDGNQANNEATNLYWKRTSRAPYQAEPEATPPVPAATQGEPQAVQDARDALARLLGNKREARRRMELLVAQQGGLLSAEAYVKLGLRIS